MNILRELRKFKRKTVLVKLQILLLFAVMLIASTYAWWRLPTAEISNLRATVDTWEVEYNIDDNEILDEEIIISVDDFQPGMTDFEKTISIRNLGTKSSRITYELTSVKLFGEEVLTQLQDDGEIALAGNTVNLFVNSSEPKYPFDICYVYDKSAITGQYVDDETTPQSVAKLTFYVSWEYDKGTDFLDTVIGQRAYEFYEDTTNNPEDVLQFTVKITSDAVHLVT